MPSGIYLTTEQIKRRLGPRLAPLWSSRCRYAGFGDESYYLPTPEEIAAVVAGNPITRAWVADQAFDCDDFAFVFKGSVCLHARDSRSIAASVCLGIAWGRFSWKPEFHACNWVFDAGGDFRWIEPQTQTFYPLEECRGGLELLLV